MCQIGGISLKGYFPRLWLFHPRPNFPSTEVFISPLNAVDFKRIDELVKKSNHFFVDTFFLLIRVANIPSVLRVVPWPDLEVDEEACHQYLTTGISVMVQF